MPALTQNLPKTDPQIEFAPREISLPEGRKLNADFGWLKVPENRTKPDSKVIELAVMRLKTKSSNPAPPLVYLAGGPGGSAISEARVPFMSRLFEQILLTRDVILMDQRGTGQSKPLVTWNATQSMPADAFLSEEKAAAQFRKWSHQAIESFKQRGIDLSGYNTVESADDVEDLRKALRAEKISLLGFSYGTHLGLTTIRRHEKYVDAAVLVGTEGLDNTFKLPSTYDTQLRKISELAAQDEAVKGKVPDMLALLKKVLAKLEKEPITLTVKSQKTNEPVQIKVGKFFLQFMLRRDAGDSNDFISFPLLLYSIDNGDYSMLQRIVERRYNGLNRGISGMVMMINLSSGATASRRKQIEKEAQTALLGKVVNFPDIYAADVWGNPDLGNVFRAPLKTNIRTLFISGTLDSNTPPFQVERERRGFSNSTHLIVENAGHEDSLPDEKIQSIIIKFLNGENVRGERVSLPRPKFKPIL